MKRKIIALLLAGTMIAGAFAFAGCDAIAPAGGNTADNEQGGDGNGPQGSQGGNSAIDTSWEKDDDYHWHTEADKALHTVENGACTACGKEVTHTVGLEYELVTPATSTAARLAVSCDLDYDISNDGSYYIVKSIGEARGDIVVPGTYNGIPVKEIGENAFYAYELGGYISDPYHTTSVVLSEGIEKIGYYAFGWTKDLTNFVFPSTLTTIGERAFACTGIETIFIPKTVTTIEQRAFYSAAGPSPRVHLERSVEEMQEIEVGEAAFDGTSVYYHTETKIGETGRYWYYDNGNIVEYTNWAGMKTSWNYWNLIEIGRPGGGIRLDTTKLVVELTSYDKDTNIINCKVYETGVDDNTVVVTWTETEWYDAGPKYADWSTWTSTFVKQVSFKGKTYSISYDAEINLRMRDDLGGCQIELYVGPNHFDETSDELELLRAVKEEFGMETDIGWGDRTAYLIVR